MAALEDHLRAKGIPELYTLVDSHESYRFAELFGFKSTLETIHNRYEYMKKDL